MDSQQDMIVCAVTQEPWKAQNEARVWHVCKKLKHYVLIYYLGCSDVSWFWLGVCTDSSLPFSQQEHSLSGWSGIHLSWLSLQGLQRFTFFFLWLHRAVSPHSNLLLHLNHTTQPVGAWRWFSQVQRGMWNSPPGTYVSHMAAQTEFTFSFSRLKMSEPAAWTLGVGLVQVWEADGIRVVCVEHLPGIGAVGFAQVGPADSDAEKGVQGRLWYGNSHRLCSLVWRDSSGSARNLLT